MVFQMNVSVAPASWPKGARAVSLRVTRAPKGTGWQLRMWAEYADGSARPTRLGWPLSTAAAHRLGAALLSLEQPARRPPKKKPVPLETYDARALAILAASSRPMQSSEINTLFKGSHGHLGPALKRLVADGRAVRTRLGKCVVYEPATKMAFAPPTPLGGTVTVRNEHGQAVYEVGPDDTVESVAAAVTAAWEAAPPADAPDVGVTQ